MYHCSQTTEGCWQKVQKIDPFSKSFCCVTVTPRVPYEHSNKKVAELNKKIDTQIFKILHQSTATHIVLMGTFILPKFS